MKMSLIVTLSNFASPGLTGFAWECDMFKKLGSGVLYPFSEGQGRTLNSSFGNDTSPL